MVISSRTPEGTPNRCPVCGDRLKIEPSNPAGDAPCPRCGHLLWFTSEDLGDSRAVTPTVQVLDAESFDRLLTSATVDRGTTLTLDLSGIPYMSSPVLGKLINLKKRVGGRAGTVRLRLHPDLREVFRITRLDEVFEIEA